MCLSEAILNLRAPSYCFRMKQRGLPPRQPPFRLLAGINAQIAITGWRFEHWFLGKVNTKRLKEKN